MSITREKTQKIMWRKIKIILTIFFFIIFNFILYYLLILNVVFYKRNKKIPNLIFINFQCITIDLKYTHNLKNFKIYIILKF